MPKETFFNLVDKKRERIVEAAMGEFAEFSFTSASINRIVRKAGIPKGSFYQYFEDKKDLYMYVVGQLFGKKMAIGNAIIADESRNTFDVLRLMLKGVVSLAKENPRMSAISDQLMGDKELLKELLVEYGDVGNNWIINLIRRDIEKGIIDDDVDPELLGVVLNGMFMQVGQYVRDGGSMLAGHEAEAAYEKMIDFIEYGIRRRAKDDKC